MELTLEQELRLIQFKADISKASEVQLRELIELMFIADMKKVESYNTLLKHHWFK